MIQPFFFLPETALVKAFVALSEGRGLRKEEGEADMDA